MYDVIVCYLHRCKSWGAGRDSPLQSFDWGTAVLTVPPKFKLRRETAGSCFVVRSHKECITYYNVESAIVKLQFPLCILISGGTSGDQGPLNKSFKKNKKCDFIKKIHRV